MWNHIGEDLMTEIFKRLPPKSLLRFRSVSKSLNACITSPAFIRLHSHHRSRQTAVIIHHIRCNDPHDKQLEEECDKLMYTLHSEFPISKSHYNYITATEYPFGKHWHVICSCTGILCVLHNDEKTIHLWNPSIRRKITVPDGPLKGTYTCVFGFGFDPLIDDYKILMIKDFEGSFVYTMKTRTWRKIASPTSGLLLAKSDQCHYKGALHWVVKEYLPDGCENYYIMTFDLSSEVFSKIDLPAEPPRCAINGLKIINSCLAVIYDDFDISVIRREDNNNNTAASWSAALKIRSTLPSDKYFCSSFTEYIQTAPGDELLWCSSDSRRTLVIFNPSTNVRTELESFCGSSRIVGMTTFVESLELLDMQQGTSCEPCM